MRRLSTLLAIVVSAACVAPPPDADWGDAAWTALSDGDVWIPAAGAGLFLLDDFDQRASGWAVRHKPLFDSRDSAKRFSDRSAIGLGLFTGLWLFAVDHAAHPETLTVDGWIAGTALIGPGQVKNLIRRQRPDEEDEDSMPSGHAVSSFALASALSHDLDAMPLLEGEDGLKLGLRSLVYTVAGASSWARVEAKRHHLADVLLGAAMGNFVTRFVNNLYDGPAAAAGAPTALFAPSADGLLVGASWRF